MSLDKAKMPDVDASGFKFAVIASCFNQNMVDALLNDAVKTFKRAGVPEKSLKIVRVPGACELPVIASILADSSEYDCVVVLGVVIAGETPHHEIIAHSTANAFQKIAVETTVPVINGVIVANNYEQAANRTIGKIARGVEFAEAAIQMAWQTSLLLDETEF